MITQVCYQPCPACAAEIRKDMRGVLKGDRDSDGPRTWFRVFPAVTPYGLDVFMTRWGYGAIVARDGIDR